jgi:hypothetical protein
LKTRAYEAERSQTDNVLKISSLEKEVKEMKRDLTEFDEVKARLEESVREVNKELSFLQNKHDDSVREYEAQIKDYKSQLDGTSLIRIHVAVWIVCSVGTTCHLPPATPAVIIHILLNILTQLCLLFSIYAIHPLYPPFSISFSTVSYCNFVVPASVYFYFLTSYNRRSKRCRKESIEDG